MATSCPQGGRERRPPGVIASGSATVPENFSEMPGDRHAVSANASTTEPAKLLAVFVVDTDETVLTTPIHK